MYPEYLTPSSCWCTRWGNSPSGHESYQVLFLADPGEHTPCRVAEPREHHEQPRGRGWGHMGCDGLSPLQHKTPGNKYRDLCATVTNVQCLRSQTVPFILLKMHPCKKRMFTSHLHITALFCRSSYSVCSCLYSACPCSLFYFIFFSWVLLLSRFFFSPGYIYLFGWLTCFSCTDLNF